MKINFSMCNSWNIPWLMVWASMIVIVYVALVVSMF